MCAASALSYDPNDDDEASSCTTDADCAGNLVCTDGTCSTTQCSDTIDNDGDTLVDTNDPGCHTDGDPTNAASYDPTDDDETNAQLPQCSDFVDNDGDSVLDTNDPGCHTDGDETDDTTYDENDDDETNVQCNDGIGNDGDGSTDASDPGCGGDGVGCTGYLCDDDETNPPAPECSDTVDNDGDGVSDTNDPSCHTDGDETNPVTYDPNDDQEEDLEPDLWIEIEPQVVSKGGSATVSWGTYVDFTLGNCTASANPPDTDWSGPVDESGSTSVTPDNFGIITYTIACTNVDDEFDSDDATVIVPFIQEVLP